MNGQLQFIILQQQSNLVSYLAQTCNLLFKKSPEISRATT